MVKEGRSVCRVVDVDFSSGICIGCAGDDTSSDEDTLVVGITQILEHDSLIR